MAGYSSVLPQSETSGQKPALAQQLGGSDAVAVVAVVDTLL